jgi:Mrp family chromosome partitioning ATPase
LFLISGGTTAPNPAELLGSEKMHDLLQQLRAQFEFIFVDSSPVLAVSDPVFLSIMVDGTLFVVNSRTPKPLIKKARTRLNIPQSKLLGMLLNRVDIHKDEYSGYYQQYYTYYQDAPRVLDDGAIFENGNGRTPASSANGHGRSSRRRRHGQASVPRAATPPGSDMPAIAPERLVAVVSASLNTFIGPMAPMIVAQHVRALGESVESFPPARLEELVRSLSDEIPTHLSRRQFEQAMRGEIEKLGAQPASDWRMTEDR